MGSSADSDRSISSGISIPQWMKNKINDRYDIEETFSPPTHDDSFFYIRYPKSSTKARSPARGPEPVKLVEEVEQPHIQDFSQHTLPCQQFIPSASMNTDIKGSTVVKPLSTRLKPQVDDIDGGNGACGKSVVDVAKQMISSKSVFKGFKVNTTDSLTVPPPPGSEVRKRRGSKSLPASPLGSPTQSPSSSPRINRKIAHPNRFFTGTFQVPEKESFSGDEGGGANFGSWIWSGLLRSRESSVQPAKSLSTLREDHGEKTVDKVDGGERENHRMVYDRSPSVEDQKESAAINITVPVSNEQEKVVLQPKPSELREMNFWSPTSM